MGYQLKGHELSFHLQPKWNCVDALLTSQCWTPLHLPTPAQRCACSIKARDKETAHRVFP